MEAQVLTEGVNTLKIYKHNKITLQGKFLGKISKFKSIQQAEQKHLTVNCNFLCEHYKKSTSDIHLRGQFIRGVQSNEIREKLLQTTSDPTNSKPNAFSNVVSIASPIEASKLDSRVFRESENVVPEDNGNSIIEKCYEDSQGPVNSSIEENDNHISLTSNSNCHEFIDDPSTSDNNVDVDSNKKMENKDLEFPHRSTRPLPILVTSILLKNLVISGLQEHGKNVLSTHLDYKYDHEEKVCVPSGKKIVVANRRKSEFLITENLTGLIKQHIDHQFNLSNSKFHVSICSTCRRTIMESKKSNPNRPLPTMPNYVDMHLAEETRTRTTSDWNCFIFLTARFRGHSKIVKGKSNVRTFDTIIGQNCGLHGAASYHDLPSTSGQSNTEKITSMNFCNACFQKTGKGLRHYCGAGPSSFNARENVLSLVERLPEKEQKKSTHLEKRIS
ncbi:unnamed protein product [Psylliodes chrysocephalus]|uniref:Uncharacterized protein n=1 Tax=Psylliodes chrysocephalus TaxID=3402493 RepID=A0A9P0GJK9_9CUCU|nr:unnamed protein product [Psylliodes chrysocephala]